MSCWYPWGAVLPERLRVDMAAKELMKTELFQLCHDALGEDSC